MRFRLADRDAAGLFHGALPLPRRGRDPDPWRAAADHAALRRGRRDAAIFGRSGSVNLLLNDAFGFTIPFMDGLNGVIFVESLHYFPFILLNLVVACEHRRRDGGVGAEPRRPGFRLFRRIIFPLAMPGYVAGASLVFVKVFDDLGTPLVLGTTNMLAPQAYLRITSIGLEDPIGYVISVIMIVFSDRCAVDVGARPEGPRLRDATAGRHVRCGSAGSRRGRPCCLRLDRRSCCCWCCRRTSAPAHFALEGVEFQRAARRLYAGHYATVFARFPGHDRQHAAVLRSGRAPRRDPRHRHRLPHPAHAPAGTADGSTGRRRPRSRFPASCSRSATCGRSRV